MLQLIRAVYRPLRGDQEMVRDGTHDANLLSVGVPFHPPDEAFVPVVDHLLIPMALIHHRGGRRCR